LHQAIARNKIEAVKVLLEYGADALLPTPQHELSTPLWIACTFHNFEILKLLLKHIGDATNVKKIVNGGKSELWPLHMPVFNILYYFMNGAT
jgi:ankyrin repeat protein